MNSRYDNWRIPSMWATADTNLFATPPGAGQTGLLLPISTVTPATFATLCPTAPYNGPNCPQHNASSGADVTNELVSQFLGQNIRSNTIELKYDFTRRVSAYVGYMYTARTIADFSATFDTGEIYFPGGADRQRWRIDFLRRARRLRVGFGRSALRLHAERGRLDSRRFAHESRCRKPATTPRGTFTKFMKMWGCVGVTARPIDALRITADLMFGYNDNSFTRISPRQLQSYKIQARYTPTPWASRQRLRGHQRESRQRIHGE